MVSVAPDGRTANAHGVELIVSSVIGPFACSSNFPRCYLPGIVALPEEYSFELPLSLPIMYTMSLAVIAICGIELCAKIPWIKRLQSIFKNKASVRRTGRSLE